ncbi:hypothetical protein DespoDRAFT_01203 [Desulfobacter postgatei 2ac9]|uniref:Uncharacterized protein n=1 Tax=Desulfobacter postgatei 2ac9 TaxID=879212 RepID=I5B106_9BACT|nr:hypothetical protein DespoDRAFT_01203 [Desulfobacter postgatei 2ac9]
MSNKNLSHNHISINFSPFHAEKIIFNLEFSGGCMVYSQTGRIKSLASTATRTSKIIFNKDKDG